MELRDRILSQAEVLFCQYGIKRITMDDIARHLGISKKTIYLHFKDKDDLVHTLIIDMLNRHTCIMDSTADESENAVREIFLVVERMSQVLSKINPMLFYDMQKFHPPTWTAFMTHRNDFIQGCIEKNIARGIEEGLFRRDLNAEILSIMRMGQVDAVFDHATYPTGKYTLIQLMTEITEHFLYGLCTIKGHHLVNKYKQLTEE